MKVTLKESTRSMCAECMREVEARVYSEDGVVYLDKTCPEHGRFVTPIEHDPERYKLLSKMDRRLKSGVSYHSLIIPITHQCNLDCKYCYFPNREKPDLPMERIASIIDGFKGETVCLSGGEPTLREDIKEIIGYITSSGRKSVLMTNGLKLSDLEYLRSLRRAGLRRVLFSFDGFDPDFYVKMKSFDEGTFEDKIKALQNLEEEKMQTTLSMTVYRGLNEHELGPTFDYVKKHTDFIREFRIRSCVDVGKEAEPIEGYKMSGFLKVFEEQTGYPIHTRLKQLMARHYAYSPHSVTLNCRFIKKREGFIYLPRLAALDNMVKLAALKLARRGHVSGVARRVDYKVTTSGSEGLIRSIPIHFASWPTREAVDLNELGGGVAHLYGGREVNFNLANILRDEL